MSSLRDITRFVTGARYFSLAFSLAVGIALALGIAALVAYTNALIAAAVIVALVAATIVIWNLENALFATIGVAVLLPFAALPVNLGFAPTLLDLALVSVFTLWILRALMRQNEEGLPFNLTPMGAFVLVFIALAVFSFVLGMSHAGITVYGLRHFVEILVAIAFFFLVANVVRTRAQLERVIRVLLLVGFVSALLGVVFYLLPRPVTIQLLSLLRVFKYPSGAGVLRFINDDPTGTMRAISTTVDPNVLGGLMVLIGGLLAPQVFASRPLFPRRWAVAMTLTVFACLGLTFSRAAILGLVVALMLVAATRYRRLILILAAAGLVFYFAPFTQGYVEHFQNAFFAADRSTQMRLGEYKDAFILISRNPIFGVGFLGSPDVDTYVGVSSVYLLMAEEMGLVGLGIFIVTMGAYYLNAAFAWFTRLADDEFLSPVLLGITAALAGSMTAGIFDHYFFNLDFPHSVTLFWLYVGLGMATIRLGKETANSAV